MGSVTPGRNVRNVSNPSIPSMCESGVVRQRKYRVDAYIPGSFLLKIVFFGRNRFVPSVGRAIIATATDAEDDADATRRVLLLLLTWYGTATTAATTAATTTATAATAAAAIFCFCCYCYCCYCYYQQQLNNATAIYYLASVTTTININTTPSTATIVIRPHRVLQPLWCESNYCSLAIVDILILQCAAPIPITSAIC